MSKKNSESGNSKHILALLVVVLGVAVFLGLGFHHKLLRWGVETYLGEILRAKVEIGELHGGFLSGISAKDVRLYHRTVPTPLLAIDKIDSDFRLLGGIGGAKNCSISHPKIFLEECLTALGEFSLPLGGGLMILPPSRFWEKATFSISDVAILQSSNRQDNVLFQDIGGSLTPSKNQRVEFFVGTSKTSPVENRVQVYGTFQTSRKSSNMEFLLDWKQLETLNLFLRSLHVLKGYAHIEGKVRSGKLESALVECNNMELFFPKDGRVLKNLQVKLAANEQYVSVRECSGESNGIRFDVTGDAQRVAFRSGRIDIENFLAKSRLSVPRLSTQPLDLDFQTTATIFYRHPDNLVRLQWHDDILESLSILHGKVNVNKLMDLEFQGKYSPGIPLELDYKIMSLAFDKIKKDWFGDKLGSLFEGAFVAGEGHAVCQWEQVKMNGQFDWNDSKMAYRFLWANQQLKLEDFRIGDATTLLGRLDLAARENSELVFHFQDESITRFIQAMGSSKTTSLTGKFTGKLEFRGNMLDPTIQGAVELRNGALRGIPYREGQIQLRGKFPKIYLDRSILYLRKDMPLALNGFIDLSEKDVFKNIHSEISGSAVTPKT